MASIPEPIQLGFDSPHLCECGCGHLTLISGKTYNRYIPGHSSYRQPPEQRFWKHVDKSGGPDACWPWTGVLVGGKRYGKLAISGEMILTHRYSYELHYGPIPDGLYVCHTCDNPPCVNPAHLWLGTPRDNALDMVQKGRQRRPR